MSPVTLLTAARRIAAHRTVAAAAALTVLLASLTFAVLGTETAGVADAGTRQALASAPAGSTTLMFSSSLSAKLAAADRGVATATRRLLRPYPARIVRAETVARIHVSTPGGDITAAGAVADTYDKHLRLLSGDLPSQPGDVLVPAEMARSAGLRAGDSVVVVQHLPDTTQTQSHRVSGVYEPSDRDPLFWAAVLPAADPTTGLRPPLMFLAPDFIAAPDQLDSISQALWYAQPDFSRATLAGVTAAATRVLAVENGDVNRIAFSGTAPPVSGLSVTSALPRQVMLVKAAEAIGLSGFLIVGTLLAVLAGFALLLTLRLVREHTAEESRLMRSRGAPTRFLVGTAVVEGVLLVLPALIVTPFVAPLARGLRHLPDLHGLPEPSRPVGIALTADALLAVSCVAIQALVAWRSSRERPTSQRVRGARGPAFQRAGLDAGLAVLAVVGYLQLRHDRSPVSTGSTVPSIDPVLVVAPAVTAAAAAALALRLLPPAARLADRRLERSRDLTAALGGWQVSRGIARTAGTVLLLVLALAVGAMTVTAAAMRTRSATDRAAFQIGADARVTGSAVGDIYQHAVMSAVPGVAAATPRADMDAAAGTQPVSLVGVDSAALPGVLAMRRDLAAGSTAAVFAPLSAPSGNLKQDGPDPAVVLPGRPRSLDFDLTLSARTLPGDGHSPRDAPDDFLTHAALAVDLRDREGVPLVLPVPPPSAPGIKTHVSIPLAVDGRTPDYPLRFEGFELVRQENPDSLELDLTVGFPPGVAVGEAWHVIDTSIKQDELNDLNGQFAYDTCDGRSAGRLVAVPVICASFLKGGTDASAGQLTLRLATGHRPGAVDAARLLRLAIGAGPPPDPVPLVPAVATDAFLAATSTAVGGRVYVTLDDESKVQLAIVGRVKALPGHAVDDPAAAVDRPLLTQALVRRDAEPTWTVSWLLKLAPGGEAAMKAYMASHPDIGSAEYQKDVADTLRGGGFAGSQSALLAIGAATAPVFAAVGFAVSAVTTLRSRRHEFAVLRAIGARPRQLSTALWIEQVVPAALSVVVGVAIGVAAALVTVPLVAVDDAGAPVFPAVAAAVPWLRSIAIAGGTAAAVTLVAVLAARALSQVDLARTLRAGDEP